MQTPFIHHMLLYIILASFSFSFHCCKIATIIVINLPFYTDMEATQIAEKGVVVVEGSETIAAAAAAKQNEELLKNIIATHPLYQLLIQSHINCLKVGLSEAEEFDATSDDAVKKMVNSKSKAASTPNTSELDHFMEAYCMALSKLKEAIEEPTKETNAFIRATYHELKQLDEVNQP